jgi:flagellar basal-body rod modification protein FlgD
MIAGIDFSTIPGDEIPKQSQAQDIGRDAFLKMFMAQLQHQDPLNPMEGTEFTAQIAQFSSLEQLYNVNDNLESIEGLQSEVGRFEALNLMDKEILARGNRLTLDSAHNTTGSLRLSSQGDCAVVITDLAGQHVRNIDLGPLSAGEHFFQWDGMTEGGRPVSPGIYCFQVIAIDGNGQAVPAEPFITGRVNRVSLEGSTPTVYVGQIAIDLSDVMDIKLSESNKPGNEAEAASETLEDSLSG